MDPYDIEDTSDWLGTPTQLDTITHYASMLEEDVQRLNRQLRAAKGNIAGLVEMNDKLSIDLKAARQQIDRLEAETTQQLSQIRSLSMIRDQNNKLRRKLRAAEAKLANGSLP